MTLPPTCLVIFDCDGVLVDSERLAVAIQVQAIEALGWDITQAEVINRLLGRSDADIFKIIEQHIGKALPDQWNKSWRDKFREVFDEHLEAVPGVVEAIKVITAQGFQTCVASSGSHDKMQRTLGKTGLWEFFDGRIFSASEVRCGKPEPDLFLHAARQRGLAPNRCLVVEDSRYGVEGAKSAGMTAIGFAGGITPANLLEQADIVITDMADLPGAIVQLLGETTFDRQATTS